MSAFGRKWPLAWIELDCPVLTRSGRSQSLVPWLKNDEIHVLDYGIGDDETLNKGLGHILNADSLALRYKEILVISKGIPR
jgi:hypothetical protein